MELESSVTMDMRHAKISLQRQEPQAENAKNE